MLRKSYFINFISISIILLTYINVMIKCRDGFSLNLLKIGKSFVSWIGLCSILKIKAMSN